MPQAYSPTESTPYQAYQPPEVAPAPPPTQLTQQQPYQFTGAPTTHLGAAAGLLDNIFRGYMRGREEGQAKQLMQMKAKSDNLRNSYNQDAQLLYQMAQSGVDPSSDEYKQAVSAVQGSWGALQEWVGQHVNGEDTKTGKKSKKAKQEQSDPLLDLKSPDPNVRARALYQVQQKMGPPVMWQVKQLQTPEAIAARKAQQTSAQAAEVGAGNTLTREQAEKDRNDILNIPEDQRTDPQKAKLKSAEDILAPPVKATSEYEQTRAAIARKVAEDPNYVLTDSEKNILAGGKPTVQKPVRGWIKGENGKTVSALLDPQTNQIIPGSEDPSIVPPSSLGGKITTGVFHYVDEKGNVHAIQETHTSMPIGGGSAPVASPQAQPGHGGGSGAPSAHSAAGGGSKDKVLGYKGSQEYKDLQKQEGKARDAYNGADTMLKTIEEGGTMQKAKNGDGPAQVTVISAFIKGIIGGQGSGIRVTQTEWNQAVETAPILQRIGAHFTPDGYFESTAKVVSPEQIDSMVHQLKAKKSALQHEVNSIQDQLKEQKTSDTGTQPNSEPQKPSPQTHRFSLSAWKKANPNGDTAAAEKAAKAAGYVVGP